MLLVAPQQPPPAGRPVIPGRGGMLWTAPPVAPGTGLWGLPQGPGFPPPTPGYNLPPSAMVTSSRGGGAGVAMRHTLVPHGPAGGSLVQASPPPPGVSPAYDPTQKSHKNKFTHFKLPAESSSPTQPLAFTYTGAVPSATTKNAIRVEDRAALAGEPQRSPRPPRSHRRRGESPRSSSSSDAASPRRERHRRHRRRRAAKGGEAPSNPPDERHSRAAEEKKPASSPARRSHSAPLPSEQPPPRKDSRHRHSRRRERAAAPRERAEKGGRPERRHRHRRKGAGAVAEVTPSVPPPVPAPREAAHRSRRHRRVEEGGESGAPRHPRRRHRGGPHRDKESSPTTKKAAPMPQRKHSKRSEPDGRPPRMPSAARRHRRASNTSSSSSSESVTRSSRSLSDRGRRGILRSEELSQPQGKTTSKSRQDGHENEKKPKKRNFLFRFLHLTPSSRRDSGVAPKNEMDNPPPTPGRHAGHNIPPHIQQQSAHLHQPPSIPTPKPLRIPSV